MVCALYTLGLSWQHINHLNLFIVYQLQAYLKPHMIVHRIIHKLKVSCTKSAYYSICDDCHVNVIETWMNGN